MSQRLLTAVPEYYLIVGFPVPAKGIGKWLHARFPYLQLLTRRQLLPKEIVSLCGNSMHLSAVAAVLAFALMCPMSF
eukprot:2945724-Alexandrium_andersonii.AAC.1